MCEDGSSHAQGGQSRTPVPTKNKLRAGRRASDRIQVLLYALGGEKSVMGGICNPSVAPHLNRKFVREVRSEFLWAADGACKRSTCKVVTLTYTSVCSSCNFSFKQRKVYKTPERGHGFRARRGVAGGASPSPTVGEWRLCADGSPHAQGGQSRTPVPTKK